MATSSNSFETSHLAGRVTALGVLALLAVMVAPVFSLILVAAGPAHASTTFTVDSTRDEEDAIPGDGVCDADIRPIVTRCTLRAAIEEANATDGADTINFDIEGSGPHTIAPSTQLPTIADTVTINGYSQPGARPNNQEVGTNAILEIELSGASAPGANGLIIGAPKTVVKGLAINRFGSSGIRIAFSATPTAIQGNFIGTDPGGTLDRGNHTGVRVSGVNLDSSPTNVTVGGTSLAARNLISGNDSHGVDIDGTRTRDNKVQGNLIGTDKTGTADLGNGWDGVVIVGSPDNLVGGTASGARNVISGNNRFGIFITNTSATGNEIMGNYIGTDATGAQDLGNAWDGVLMQSAPQNLVGGTASGARNVISGNGRRGVAITFGGATGNKVQGNYIGTKQDGTGDLGNSSDGMLVHNAPGNFVGGTDAQDGTVDGVVQARNVISGNDRHGVVIDVTEDSGATGNRILGNSIFSNTNLGIDLYGNGRTANDPQDPDTGPNNLQNFPVITSATTSSTATTIRGTLDSTPSTTFTVQFFRNPAGTDEGKNFIGQKRNVSTDASGDATFTFRPDRRVGAGASITATATDTEGSTSEFSDPETVIQTS